MTSPKSALEPRPGEEPLYGRLRFQQPRPACKRMLGRKRSK